MDIGIIFLIVIGAALAIPIWLYARQSTEYQQKQVESVVLVEKNMSSRTWAGIILLPFLLAFLFQGQKVSVRDLYISIACTIL